MLDTDNFSKDVLPDTTTTNQNSTEPTATVSSTTPANVSVKSNLLNWSIQTKIIAIFVVLALILLIFELLSFVSLISSQQTDSLLNHTNQIIDGLNAIELQVTNAETGQRGYLLTGNNVYLQPYQTAVKTIPKNLNFLNKLLADNTQLQQQLNSLSSNITVKLNELQSTIDLYNAQSLAAALNVVNTNEGQTEMDNIRQSISTMTSEERALLQQRLDSQRTSNVTSLITTSILVVINICLFLFGFYLVRRDLARREILTQELESLNSRLEQGILDRTKALTQVNQNLEAEIGERLKAEEKLSFLIETSSNLADALDYSKVLQVIVNLAVPKLADFCLLYLTSAVSNGNVKLVRTAVSDSLVLTEAQELYWPEEITANAEFATAQFFEQAVANRKSVLVSDAESISNKPAYSFQSALFVPLLLADELQGLLVYVTTETSRHYSEEDLALFEELAKRCTLALEKARLYQETYNALTTQKELDYLKDLFLSVTGHELRTPLTAVKGYAQLIEREISKQANAENLPQELATKLERLVTNVNHQANRMHSLVQQLLDFSRIQNNKLQLQLTEHADLNALIERVVSNHRVTTPNNTFIYVQEATDLKATYDENLIEQVLDNLINNAVKYSPSHSTITVTLYCGEEPTSQQPAAIVKVSDEGMGISPEEQQHIFDRFYRVRNHNSPKIEGLGLGLYISYEIMLAHKGRMWVESEVGKGSNFYFSLPLPKAC